MTKAFQNSSSATARADLQQQLQAIKHRFVDAIWRSFIIIILIGVPLSVSRSLATGWLPIYNLHLAYGVLTGVLLSALFFAHKIGHLLYIYSHTDDAAQTRVYQVSGQVFFASAERFIAAFEMNETLPRVVIDLQHAHLWDVTAVASLDKVVLKLRKNGRLVEVLGLNQASATLVDQYGVHHKADPDTLLARH